MTTARAGDRQIQRGRERIVKVFRPFVNHAQKLESLDVIETLCWDGSCLHRLVPVDKEQAALLEVLAHILAKL